MILAQPRPADKWLRLTCAMYIYKVAGHTYVYICIHMCVWMESVMGEACIRTFPPLHTILLQCASTRLDSALCMDARWWFERRYISSLEFYENDARRERRALYARKLSLPSRTTGISVPQVLYIILYRNFATRKIILAVEYCYCDAFISVKSRRSIRSCICYHLVKSRARCTEGRIYI